MNLPNKLTCSRFVSSLLVLICLSFQFPFAKTLAFFLFVLACITDWLDGWLARTKYGVSDFGKLMDPLADKVLVAVALVCFTELRFDLAYPEASLVPAFLVVPILVREFMVTGLRLLAVEQGQVISAGPLGKWKTALQMVAISVTLLALLLVEDVWSNMDPDRLRSIEYTLHWIIWFLMACAAFITVLSGWDYFRRHANLFLTSESESNDE